jgi:pyrroline-5-carboxylate reductase
MRIGVIGSGNLARALVRGWGEPVLLTDGGSGRAAVLAGEVGGEAMASNADLTAQADLVVLCHKPYQLDAVAHGCGGTAKAIVSTLAGLSAAQVGAAWPGVPVVRVLPNTATELRAGVSVVAEPEPGSVDEGLLADVLALFERVGVVVRVEERLMGAANAISGVGPAYLALVAEAWADAAVRHGLKPAQASALVAATMNGTAALLDAHHGDTLGVRRAVTSPGGVTARGLDALERHGLRGAFAAAADEVLDA